MIERNLGEWPICGDQETDNRRHVLGPEGRLLCSVVPLQSGVIRPIQIQVLKPTGTHFRPVDVVYGHRCGPPTNVNNVNRKEISKIQKRNFQGNPLENPNFTNEKLEEIGGNPKLKFTNQNLYKTEEKIEKSRENPNYQNFPNRKLGKIRNLQSKTELL